MSEYPKVMTHPNAVKAKITAVESTDAAGRTVRDYMGTADRFPPVTVTNADQEERHRAQGYVTQKDQVKQQQYEDYPVWLKHPKTEETMLATSAQHEAELGEQGFQRQGVGDPEAVRRAYAVPHIPNRTTEEYPKMVNGVLVQDPEKDHTGFAEYPKWVNDPDKKRGHNILVSNRHEEELAKEQLGISNEARPAEQEPSPEDGSNEIDLDAIDDKDTLISLAKERNVKYDKRWSVAKFRSVLRAA